MNPDFETFKEFDFCFLRETDEIKLLDIELGFALTSDFQKTFPKLSEIVKKARILNLEINNQSYKLFSWTNKAEYTLGWLNKIEKNIKPEIELILEHKLLLNEIGGIQESFNGPPKSNLWNNQRFMFIETECRKYIGGWEEYYRIVCEDNNKTPIDFKKFICFVQEANGSVTLYDKNSKEVMLFAADHNFYDVKFLENQPKYTFHKINGITTFVDYVERLATEWSNEIL